MTCPHAEPVPCRGALSLWSPGLTVLQDVAEQLGVDWTEWVTVNA